MVACLLVKFSLASQQNPWLPMEEKFNSFKIMPVKVVFVKSILAPLPKSSAGGRESTMSRCSLQSEVPCNQIILIFEIVTIVRT